MAVRPVEKRRSATAAETSSAEWLAGGVAFAVCSFLARAKNEAATPASKPSLPSVKVSAPC